MPQGSGGRDSCARAVVEGMSEPGQRWKGMSVSG